MSDKRKTPRKRKAEHDAPEPTPQNLEDEALEMVRAIRAGEIDALVVSSERGDQVFTLQSARYLAGCILEQATDAIFICDHEGRILRASLLARELCHGAPEFKAFDELVKLQVLNEPNIPFSVHRVLGGTPVRKLEVLGTNGLSDRHFLLNGQPLLQGEKVIGALLILFDVTERVQLEAERERLLQREQAARAQAEAANRAKDDFLATLSHEMRTPLNAMMGWVKLLRTGALNPQQIERGLETIERNVLAQRDLIEDLLDVSRVISGKLQLKRERVDIGELIREAVDAMTPQCATKGIFLSAEIVGGPHIVEGDAMRLRQIVDNLLGNALKFTPAKGSIKVRVSRVGGTVQIRVTDSGIGIKSEFLPFIFERFRQAESALSRTQKGLGLGLALVRHLAEAHGGAVYADSAGENRGTMFMVSLPVALTPDLVQPVRRAGDYGDDVLVGNPHILIVEDDTDSRELLAMLLQSSGATVMSVDSAAAAFAAMEKFQPHVLISDIGMPREDGLTMIGKIRASAPKDSRLPAIALSAFAQPRDHDVALARGFDAYLTKPVDAPQLFRVINSLVREARSMVVAQEQ